MKKILLLSLAFLILSSNILFAQTKEFIGVIGAAIGDIKNQKDEILENGSNVYYGDTIVAVKNPPSFILIKPLLQLVKSNLRR